MNPDKKTTSHGHSADAKATPVPEYKSYGGGGREEVAGGQAGRGNGQGAVVDTGETWGRGEKSADEDLPVAEKPGATKANPFSDGDA